MSMRTSTLAVCTRPNFRRYVPLRFCVAKIWPGTRLSLVKLKNTIPSIIDSLERTKKKLEEKQRELESEGESIHRDIGSLQQAQNSLKHTVGSAM